DHDLDFAWALQHCHEIFDLRRAADLLPGGGSGDEIIHDLSSAVIDSHRKAIAFHIEDQILAHDGKSDQPEIVITHAGINSPVLSTNTCLHKNIADYALSDW